MKKIAYGFLFVFIVSFCLGQTKINSVTKKNYCEWCQTCKCNLKPDDPAHFDPYYNGHLCENFNPKQADFSNEYYQLRVKTYSKEDDKLNEFLKYDFSPVWLTGDWVQNGVLGLNYQRIQIHIDNVIKNSENPYVYSIFGKSKVNNNICDFKGEIKLLKVFLYEDVDNEIPAEHKKYGELFASYLLSEDSTKMHSGIFKGVTECSFYLDSSERKIQLDESNSDADGYRNRDFVGIWKEYKTNQVKKCIWGDYRLPFTFDFDDGDGEMRPNDKYRKNGWQTYYSEEFIELPDGKYVLKDKWWLNNKK
jgi:hypothetical protein